MYIKIKEKIEQINKEPEHIRMRYVWGCVVASMSIIFIVWVFSIVSMFTGHQEATADNDNNSTLENQLQELGKQAASLKGIGNKTINEINEGLVDQDDVTYPDSSQENVDSANPQSGSYADKFNPNAIPAAQQ